MFSLTARRCSTTTALIVGSLFAGGLTAASADAATPRSATTNLAAAQIGPSGPGQIAAPQVDTPDPPAPAPVAGGNALAGEAPISLSTLTSRIESALSVNGGPTGWAYSVSKGDQNVGGNSGGFARRPSDQNNIPGGLAFGQGTRIQLMSVTKPITAMAIVRALDLAPNVDVDTPVSAYLPAGWAKGPGFAANSASPITFRHLLTHTSGVLQEFQDPANDISSWGNRWASLQPLVANGASPNVAAGEQYKNANYALLRVLLPKLWSLADGPQTATTEANHGYRFLSYVNTRILAPAGVNETSCWDNNDFGNTFAYNRTNVLIGGTPLGYADDTRNECGGHAGLFLSSRDLVKVTATLRESTKIMSQAARNEMFAGRLGWSTGSNRAGTSSANVWWHGGDGFYSQGRELHTCVMNAPQQYQLSLVMNSTLPGNRSQCGILLDAVNAARTAS
ncbi:MAG: beta-lactamase family protein [Solirubrobacteraceae bacterium]|nr:beta-lactamase family protein [Solirubrobacteraceae bacterium]